MSALAPSNFLRRSTNLRRGNFVAFYDSSQAQFVKAYNIGSVFHRVTRVFCWGYCRTLSTLGRAFGRLHFAEIRWLYLGTSVFLNLYMLLKVDERDRRPFEKVVGLVSFRSHSNVQLKT
jgi:hypothetical protein